MKQPRKISPRQLTLLEHEVSIRLDEKVREKVINVLADLLLEALSGVLGESVGVRSESED